MKVLVLDDNPARMVIFRQIFAGDELTCCFQAGLTIRLLKTQRWDLVHLDHDLGDFVDSPDRLWTGREMTGADVCDAIAALPPERRPDRVVVHSWNPVGAQAMIKILRAASVMCSWEPFADCDPQEDGEPA